MNLTTIEKQLLDIMQNRFPIVPEPFAHIAKSLGIIEEEVIERIQKMKADGMIRRIGPVFDAKSLGYVSALFAVKVPQDQEQRAADHISTFPEVTHNYHRDNEFNIWFTLIAENNELMDEVISNIKEEIAPQKIIKLRSKKVFKIKGIFDVK